MVKLEEIIAEQKIKIVKDTYDKVAENQHKVYDIEEDALKQLLRGQLKLNHLCRLLLILILHAQHIKI
jgi:hypothetical protein